MIRASDITYSQFIQLKEADRMTLQEAYIVRDCALEIDCYSWAWGEIKSLQDRLKEDVSYFDVLEIAKKAFPKLHKNSPAATVVSVFNHIQKQVDEITEGESIALGSEMTAKEKMAAENVGGFDRFGNMPQTFALVSLMGTPYLEVLKIPYYICFAALAYDHTKDMFQRELIKK